MLAQDWLTGINRARTEYDGYLQTRLELPAKFDPYSTAGALNRIAERIVYTDDIPSLMYELHRNKQITYRGLISSARMPFDCFWLEYGTKIGGSKEREMGIRHTKYGALVERHNDTVRIICVIGFVLDGVKDIVTAITHALVISEWPPPVIKKADGKYGFSFTISWELGETEIVTDDGRHMLQFQNVDHITLGSILTELAFGIFLVTQPKTYSEEVVKWDERKQLARAQAGKRPLLEYRRIRMKIGTPAKRYEQKSRSDYAPNMVDTESLEAVQHRRYHKVMGHFRHYMNAAPPRTIWIEQHYRGDPALGVTFTERDVTI